MKIKFSINTRVLLGLVAAGSIGLSGTAFAQNPRLYPPAKSSSSPPSESKSKSDTKAKGDKLSSGDKAFMKDAAEGGMMEVAMGRVAEKNASDSQVKNFGAQMVKDHGKANNELKALAKQENVELPAEKEAGKWKSDKDYMDAMVKDHEKDLAAFEKQAKEGSDPDVKTFASKTAKVVRKHLDMAKEIDGKLK
jgi:putative membrane protein